MRTTVKLRIRDASRLESFVKKLDAWLIKGDEHVSIQINNERWQHYGSKTVSRPVEEVRHS